MREDIMKIKRIITAFMLLLALTVSAAFTSFAAGPGVTVVPDGWDLCITRFGSLTYKAHLKEADKKLEPQKYIIEIYSMRDGVNWKQYGSQRKTSETSLDISYSHAALYRFRVKIQFVGGFETEWSDFSDSCTVTAEDTGSGSSGGPGTQGGTLPIGPGVSGNTVPVGPGTTPSGSPAGPGITNGKTGWYQYGGKWYYAYANNTYAHDNWEHIDGKWYYFNTDGSMKTDWLYRNGNWYYLLPSGQMATGFNNINEVWYYFNQSGIMLTGYQVIDGYTYYFDVSGANIRNTYAPDGNFYDNFGRLTTPVRN